MKNVLLLLALALAGCALFQAPSGPPEDRVLQHSEPYTIAVRSLGASSVTPDGFEARYRFDIISPYDLQRNSLVQELYQTTTLTFADGSISTRRLSLVEAFSLTRRGADTRGNYRYSLMPGQRDRHSVTGLRELGPDVVKVHVERKVFAYVANVHDADFSDGGFAHLPGSEDGLVVSRIGPDFNAEHQRKHKTQGRISDSATAHGLTYGMTYTHMRKSPAPPEFHFNPAGPPLPPPVNVSYAAAR